MQAEVGIPQVTTPHALKMSNLPIIERPKPAQEYRLKDGNSQIFPWYDVWIPLTQKIFLAQENVFQQQIGGTKPLFCTCELGQTWPEKSGESMEFNQAGMAEWLGRSV